MMEEYNITYQSVRECQIMERKVPLQRLPPNFYNLLSDHLQELEDNLHDEAGLREYTNMISISQDIIDNRLHKIIKTCLYNIHHTNDTPKPLPNLQEHEKEFYQKLYQLILTYYPEPARIKL